MSVRNTLARNTAFNAAGRMWEAIVSLVLIRYVTDHIGMELFGVWVLVGALTGYVALLDLGIGSGYVKYIAEHAARKDNERLSAVVCTGFAFYFVLSLLVVAAGWPLVGVCAGAVQGYAELDAELVTEWVFLFRWGLVLFAGGSCMAAFSSVVTGLQRMDLSNAISFLASLVKIASTVAFIENGHAVRSLLYAQALAFGAFAGLSLIAAFYLAPGLRIGPRYVRPAEFRTLFGFGIRAQVARLANLVAFETDKIVAGLLYGAGMVALYEFGVTLANKMRQIPVLLLSALIPAASELDAQEAHVQLRELYVRSSKYVAAVAIPLALLAMSTAGLLLRTWMGPGHEVSAWVLRIIAVGYIANILPGGGVGIALGKGRADIPMKSGLLATGANIALTIAMVTAFGFWGIPVATVLSMFLSWWWFVRAMRRLIAVPVGELLRTTVLWPALAAIPGCAGCMLCDYLTRGLVGFLPNAVAAIGCGAWFGLTYLGLIRVFPFLDRFDLKFLGSTLRLDRVPGLRLWLRSRGEA